MTIQCEILVLCIISKACSHHGSGIQYGVALLGKYFKLDRLRRCNIAIKSPWKITTQQLHEAVN